MCSTTNKSLKQMRINLAYTYNGFDFLLLNHRYVAMMNKTSTTTMTKAHTAYSAIMMTSKEVKLGMLLVGGTL